MTRGYRRLVRPEGLVSFTVRHLETDLHVSAETDLRALARDRVRALRKELDRYIRGEPAFVSALEPVEPRPRAPAIVRLMCRSGEAASVGPMAAVAGAFAELVGETLLERSREVIVENGGDVFVATLCERVAAIHAGESPLSGRFAVRILPGGAGTGVCTSSGTVGPSLSLGKADAATVVAGSCALADACATALGNRVRAREDVGPALEWVCNIKGVKGAVVILGEIMGAAGEIELAEL